MDDAVFHIPKLRARQDGCWRVWQNRRPCNCCRQNIREVPDFPQPGILFFDLSPLYADPELFNTLVDGLHAKLAEVTDCAAIDYVAAPDARGFLAGTRLAASLGCGFIAARKPQKLPPPVESLSYGLEYGENILELSSHMPLTGKKVVVHDDVLATGGTAGAAANCSKPPVPTSSPSRSRSRSPR